MNQHLLSKFKTRYPKANIYYINPINTDKQTAAILNATNSHGYLNYNFKKSAFILNFNHDFLGSELSRISDLKATLITKINLLKYRFLIA